MFFLAVIELVLVFVCAETSINSGLPDWIPRDGWWIDIMYRAMNVLAVWLALWCNQIIAWVILLAVAYWIRRLHRRNKYSDYLT